MEKETTTIHRRQRLFAVLVPIGVVLLALLIFEVGYRVFSDTFPREEVMPRKLGHFDPQLGWGYKSNVCAVGTRGWGVSTPLEYCFNSKGLRDKEILYDNENDEFRIVLVGASRTAGWGLRLESTYASIIEQYFDNVEVINMGVAGFGYGQMALSYEVEGYKYKPQLVVLSYDVLNNRHMKKSGWGKSKPHFVIEGEGLKLTNFPVPEPPAYKYWHQWFKDNLAIYWLATSLDGQRSSNRKKRPGFREESFETAYRIFKRLDQKSREKGASLILVGQSREMHNKLTRDGIHSILVDAALDNELLLINPPRDRHHNEAGNGVLAWLIAQYMVSEGVVPENLIRNNQLRSLRKASEKPK